MKKKCAFLFPFLMIYCFAVAQPSLVWTNTYGGSNWDYARNIIDNGNGTFLVTGFTASTDSDITCYTHGSGEGWLYKINSAGKILWEKCFGGSGPDDLYQVLKLKRGGYLMMGNTSSNNGDVSGLHGGNDIWVFKTDTAFNIIWQTCIGSSANEYPGNIVALNDGGVAVFGSASYNDGTFSGTNFHLSFPYFDAFVVKLDSNGNLLKAQCFGGTGDDFFYKGYEINGKLLAVGQTNSTDYDLGSLDHYGYTDGWMVMFDDTLGIYKENTFGGENTDGLYDCIVQPDGRYIVLGRSASDLYGENTSSWNKIWVCQIDSDLKTMGGNIYGGDYGAGYTAVSTFRNRIYIIANTNSTDVSGAQYGGYDYWLLELDSTGRQLLWDNRYGTSADDIPYGILCDSNNIFILGSVTKGDGLATHFKGGQADGWILGLNNVSAIPEIRENNNDALVYPNPANSNITIEIRNHQWIDNKLSIIIYDTTGKRELKSRIKEDVQKIDVSHLSQGIYLYEFTDKHRNTAGRGKFVIQRN